MIIELPLLRRQLPLPQIIKIESILPFYFFNFFDNEEKKIIFGMIQSTMLMMMMMSDRNRTIFFLHYFFTPHSIDYIIVVAAATAAAASVKNIFFIHSVCDVLPLTIQSFRYRFPNLIPLSIPNTSSASYSLICSLKKKIVYW